MVAWDTSVSRRRHPWIAREGWPYLAAALAGSAMLYLWLGPWGLLPAAPVVVVLAFLLRDPPCQVPSDPLALVSPVQGSVVSVETGLRDPWLDREAGCIRIRVSPLDVYSVRSPTEGKVKEQWCSRSPTGRRGGSNGSHFRYACQVCTDEEDDLVMAVSAPCLPWLRRLRLHLHTGERVGQGHRIGYLLLGGEVQVWVPLEVSTEVRPGDRVRSGCSTLAHLVHRRPVTAIRA